MDLAGMEPFQALCDFWKCLEWLLREVVESARLKVLKK